MGIRNIKVMLQIPFAAPFIKNRDAVRTAIDPAAKLSIPLVYLQHSRGVRALGVDQQLLLKGAFIVIASRTKKPCPVCVVAGNGFQGIRVQLGNQLVFAFQGRSPFDFSLK